MKSGKFKIPVIYMMVAILWLLLSDTAILSLSKIFPGRIVYALNLGKGVVFVSFTGLMLFLMLNNQHKRNLDCEKQYRNIYEGNPNPIWFYRIKDFKFVSVNDAAISKYGYSRTEFLLMTIMDIRPPEDLSEVALSSRCIMPDQLHEAGIWKHLKKDGSSMFVNISSHKTSFLNEEVVMVMAQDIDLLTRSNEELKRAGEILNKISNPVIISNAKGRIIWVNPAFTAVTGYTEEEALGKSHVHMLYSSRTNDLVVRRLFETISHRAPYSVDLLNLDKFNREYWVSLNLSPIFDAQGKFECYISVHNDITERKEKEAIIGIQNEKLKVVSWLNSHQIRKPVASILALTQLMKMSETEDEKTEILGMLHQCAVELDEIILEINAEATATV